MYLGFDIGKRWHEAALLDAEGDVVRQLRFAPTRAGLQQLATWLADVTPTAVQIGLEATGIYWLTLHARLLRWEGTRLAVHPVPEERQAAAREISRLRTEMIERRARQLTKRGTLLEPLFPEFATAFADLGSPSALAVLARWPSPAALAPARASEVTRVLQAASRGHLGAATARELRERAAQSVGITDPFGATAIAVQTLVAHLEHLRAQIPTLGERLDALQAEDAPARTLLASIPGVGRTSAVRRCGPGAPSCPRCGSTRSRRAPSPGRGRRARSRSTGPTSWWPPWGSTRR